MKTRKEIEEYLNSLGIQIKPLMEKVALTGGRIDFRTIGLRNQDKINNSKYYWFKILNKDAEEALLDLISESLKKDDMETAIIAIEVLQEESLFYRGHRDAAVRKDVPLEKRIAFDIYCHEKNIGDKFANPIAEYVSVESRKKDKDKDDSER